LWCASKCHRSTANADLARKLDALEKKYDAQFKVVFDAIRALMEPPAVEPKRGRGCLATALESGMMQAKILAALPRRSTAMAGMKPRTFDIFCGAWGSSSGAKQAGAEIVGGADMWSLATQTFVLNFPNAKPYTANIVDLSPDDVLRDVGPIDLLLASPECTHHSVAKGAKPRDEASKQLAFEVLRFAEVLQPRWVFLENVIQMQRWPAFEDWWRGLMSLGYFVRVLKLDAYAFGVPQHRRRLFVICDNQREPAEPRTYCKSSAIAATILRDKNGDGIVWPFQPLDSPRRAPATMERARRALRELGDRQAFLLVYYGSDGAGGWQRLDRPLRTVTTGERFVPSQVDRLQYNQLLLA
jgi:DNA (cytosine-5)-methyltransferase 1